MQAMTVVGLDAGTSDATLAYMGGRGGVKVKTTTIPSYVGAGTLEELAELRAGGSAAGGLGVGEYVLQLGGDSFYVGDLALSQSADPSNARGDISRYWSGHSLRLLLTLAAAAGLPDGAEICVVTGLPVKVRSKETAGRVGASLVGDHSYQINGKARRLVVRAVLVVMEGAGALAAHGLPGDVPQGVIDIGGRTVDLFWANGQAPYKPRCTGEALGVEDMADRLSAILTEKHRRPLGPGEARAILQAWAAGRARPGGGKGKPLHLPAIYAQGLQVPLEGALETAALLVGSRIASFVSRAWRSTEGGDVAIEAARVLLVGGGAHYFADNLRQYVPNLITPSEPELANAIGYLHMGRGLADSDWAELEARLRRSLGV